MNFYVTNTKNCRAILFSQTDVAHFRMKYPDAIFCCENNFEKAILMAKPKNYTSQKCYAVKRGHIKGIYFTELVYHAMLVGFRDACGKKCQIKDAYYFIYGKKMPSDKKEKVTTNCAYTDGSYSSDGTIGIGYRLFCNGEIYNNTSFFRLNDSRIHSMESEILSVMLVVRDAISLGLREITIYCDNQNVVACSENILKKNIVYQNYLSFMRESRQRINIVLKKVKGHSTDSENNTVDKIVSTKRIDKILEKILLEE